MSCWSGVPNRFTQAHELITGRFSVETTKSAYDRMGIPPMSKTIRCVHSCCYIPGGQLLMFFLGGMTLFRNRLAKSHITIISIILVMLLFVEKHYFYIKRTFRQ